MLKLIVAATFTGVIGVDNKLPWNIPKEIQIFKEKTLGHTVVMGRKTYESLPKSVRPLPSRENIVISRSGFDTGNDNVKVYSDLKGYLTSVDKDKVVWIIGGASIFNESLPFVDEVHLTTIPLDIKGDSYFDLGNESTNLEVIEEHTYYENSKLLFNIDVYKRK